MMLAWQFCKTELIQLMAAKNNGPRMLRLLVVVVFYKPAYVYGGPVRSISALCEALSRLGCAVTVFTTNANGGSKLDVDTRTPCTVDGVRVFYHPLERGPFLFHSPALRQACVEQIRAFDLVYIVSCWGYPFIPAARAAAAALIPYVISPRTAFMRAAWQGKFLKKAIYHFLMERSAINRAAVIHYTSQIEADQSRWMRLKSRAVIVPNPVDLSEFAALPERGSFRERHGIAADEKVLLYLGRVEPRKGLDLAIRAFGRIASSGRRARFAMAGPEEDAHVRELQELAMSVGAGDRVMFTGMLAGAARLAAFRDADLFVLTSLAENFGMAVVEAMASGLPVVVTDTVGVAPEVAAHGAGLVVAREEHAVAAAMERMLSSEELRRMSGEAGKRLAQTAYAPDAVARLWLERFGPLALKSKMA
jgi:glycosyltransferase involved in cell wall biosynthesis